jgi:hypothetical protein
VLIGVVDLMWSWDSQERVRMLFEGVRLSQKRPGYFAYNNGGHGDTPLKIRTHNL